MSSGLDQPGGNHRYQHEHANDRQPQNEPYQTAAEIHDTERDTSATLWFTCS